MYDQRGNGRLGVIVWIALMATGVFAAVRIIPAKVAVYEFHDYCESQARFAATRGGRWDEAALRKRILDKAEELGLPLDKKKVKIKRSRSSVTVKVQHKVEVDLGFYQWVWDFDETYESLRM
ncbi:MAG: hypothetical protein Q9Q40_05415 [Acidobacteriota bacterium]|nr:hypothetical protein [Acidobacteriota bacterium]MDQ7087810.1 hypothetical protein [Acidobacteriota bacterium]